MRNFNSFCFLFCLLTHVAKSDETVSVKTQIKLGKILGKVENYEGKTYASFKGIPYAKPPIGNLRFRNPQPAEESWENERDFSQDFDVQCPQLNWINLRSKQEGPMRGEEDCLYLNVFTPKTNFDETGELLPVMVWIHGGGFITGSASPNFYGPQYFMETQKVILVTLNYRLGALGFISLDDDVISGNMGLKDQNLALQWIKDNIQNFGGDPNQVTLFGCSAGGVSVAAQLLSPWSSGLFHRAIIQSGLMTKVPFLFMSQNASYYGNQFAIELGLEEESTSEEILQFLQSKTVEEILEKNNHFETSLFTGNPWVPIPDEFSKNPFLPGDFTTLFKEGKYNKVPVIIGGTKDEGAMYMPQFLNDPERLEEFNSDFDNQAAMMLLGVDEEDVTEQDVSTVNIILREYLPGPDYNITLNNLRRVEDIFSDVLFLKPIHLQTKLLRDTLDDKPLFYYNYRHKSELTLPKLLSTESKLEMDLGVSHGDEIIPLFYEASNHRVKSKEDLEMTSKLVNIWVNFATTGLPDSLWEQVKKDDSSPKYAILDTQPIRMMSELDFESRMNFLESIFEVHDGYRNFNFLEHPAVVERLKDREEELKEEHDEL